MASSGRSSVGCIRTLRRSAGTSRPAAPSTCQRMRECFCGHFAKQTAARRSVPRSRRRLFSSHGNVPVVANYEGNFVKRSRMQIFYSGNVQGVGFRYTVKTVAAGFEVTGTVRNLADGRVELIAEGAKEELSAFQTAIRESGLEHFIRDEQVLWDEPQHDLRGFEIVR